MRTFVITLALSLTLAAGSALACDYDKSGTETASTVAPEATLASVTLTVSDTTCAGCVVPIRTELTAVKGVATIDTPEDDHHTITVTFAVGEVTTEQLIAAVKKAGFTAVVKDAPKQS